jgi:hypothetical protein
MANTAVARPSGNGGVSGVPSTRWASGTVSTHAKQPNSFLYRFIPKDRTDLTRGGILQALRVMSLSSPNKEQIPSRTMGWSSAMAIRIMT